MPILNAIENLLDSLTNGFPNERETHRLEQQLKYSWKGRNENKVTEEFQGFHRDITTALIPGNELQLPAALKEILDWGGIYKNGDMCGRIDENNDAVSMGRYAEYLLLLRDLEIVAGSANGQPTADLPQKQITNTVVINPTNTVVIKIMKEIKKKEIKEEDLYPVYCYTGKESMTPLASWTKILAAYDLQEFWIYDSRVAIALRFLNQFLETKFTPAQRGSDWYTPVPKRDDDDGDTLNLQKKIGKGVYVEDSRVKHASQCYQDYCNLLKETGKGSSCEKKLFMLGGLLNDLHELTVIQKQGFPQYQNDNIDTVRQKFGRILKIFEDLDDAALNQMNWPTIRDRIQRALRKPSSVALLDNFRRLMGDVRAESFWNLKRNGYRQPKLANYLVSLLGVQRTTDNRRGLTDEDKEALRNTLARLGGDDNLNSEELDCLRESLRRKHIALDINI